MTTIGVQVIQVEIENINQKNIPVIEMLQTKHQKDTHILHKSNRLGYRSQIDRGENVKWKKSY